MARCRPFMGERNFAGYGIRRGTSAKKYGTRFVHRQVWIMANGPIPQGMEVMHTCDFPACFLLEHLTLGLHADNMGDAATKKRTRNQNTDITQCKRGHSFTHENTYVDQTGRRHCRTCDRERKQR